MANVSASCHQLWTSGGCMREWESRTLSGSRSHLLSTTVKTFSPDGRTTHAFDLIARSSSCRLAAHEGKELRFNHRARDANTVQRKAARCCRQRQRSREARGQFGAQTATTRQRSESLHPRMRRTAGGVPHKASAEQRGESSVGRDERTTSTPKRPECEREPVERQIRRTWAFCPGGWHTAMDCPASCGGGRTCACVSCVHRTSHRASRTVCATITAFRDSPDDLSLRLGPPPRRICGAYWRSLELVVF